jgi:hypothetical protein
MDLCLLPDLGSPLLLDPLLISAINPLQLLH